MAIVIYPTGAALFNAFYKCITAYEEVIISFKGIVFGCEDYYIITDSELVNCCLKNV
jgi:hypothetical protein